MAMSKGGALDAISLRFFLPPPGLSPYVTTLYHLEVSGCGQEPVEDWLHPEWANLRIIPDMTVEAGMGGNPLEPMPRSVMAGPTSVATRFRANSGRSWGIGFMPLGWARLTEAPASDYADRYADAEADPVFERLRPLCACVPGKKCDLLAERDAMLRELKLLFAQPAAREDLILRVEEALTDPTIHSVAELAQSLGMSSRTM